MKKSIRAAAFAVAAFLTAAPAYAAAPSHDWDGPYIGAHLGLAAAQFGDSSVPTTASGNSLSGIVGGQLGYNYQSGANVFGGEADISDIGLNNDFVNFGSSHFSEDWQSTVRARYGYAMGDWLPYLTAGVAITGTTAKLDGSGSATATAVGATGGAGVDYAFSDRWSGRAEFIVTQVPETHYTVGATPMTLASTNEIFRIGVSYSLGDFLR